MMKLTFALVLIVFFSLNSAAQILINELVHTNLNTIADEDGDHPDWIELYNNSTSPINLAGYRITDNSDPNKWIFPSVTINGYGRLLIFLSGKDRTTPNLHTNFKMGLGETIQLRNASSVFQDSVVIVFLLPGNSRSRIPDGSALCYSDNLTPNTPNSGTCYNGYSSTPTFSLSTGFYSVAQTTNIAGNNVRYETDGSRVTSSSPLYSSALSMNSSMSITARSFEAGKLPSATATANYFINEPTALPVVAVTAEPGDLFNGFGGPGAYDNAPYGGGFPKVACHVAYYDAAKNFQFAENASFAVVGNWSTDFDQKPMQFKFKEEWGALDDVPNEIFTVDKPEINKLKGFRVRNLDDDYFDTRIRDQMANRMSKGTYSGWAASQNVAVYINGIYWGHYSAREILNENFCHDNFGSNPEDIDILKTRYGNPLEITRGTSDDFFDLVDFIANNSLADSANYDSVMNRLDYQNYVDYFSNEIFNENGDWFPSWWYNNTEFTTSRNPKVKWKYIQWDQAYGMYDCNDNMIDQVKYDPNQSPHSAIFNALIINTEFKIYFVNRFADLLNTNYSYENVHQLIAADSAEIDAEISLQYNRWNGYWPQTPDYNTWIYELSLLKDFYSCRVDEQRDHLQSSFGLQNGLVSITVQVNPPSAGFVKISTITSNENVLPWTGIYFKDIPITLTAIADSGFEFANWDINSFISDTSLISFTNNITSDTIFIANFDSLPPLPNSISEKDESVLKIYPNPSNGIFQIYTASAFDFALTNILGEDIFRSRLNNGNNLLDLSAYSSGIYFLKPIDADIPTFRLMRVE